MRRCLVAAPRRGVSSSIPMEMRAGVSSGWLAFLPRPPMVPHKGRFFCGEPRAGQTSPPGPLSTWWRGGITLGPGPMMALDCGFCCNGQRLGAMNHAPTKNTFVRLWSPRFAGGRTQHVAPLRPDSRGRLRARWGWSRRARRRLGRGGRSSSGCLAADRPARATHPRRWRAAGVARMHAARRRSPVAQCG